MCWVKDHINWVTLHFFWFRINCSLLSRLSQGHEDQVLHSSFASQHNWGHRGCPIPDLHWTVPGFAFPRASARGNWLNNLRQYKVQPGCLHPAFIYYILACFPFPKRPHSSRSSGSLQLFPWREPWRVGGCVLYLTCPVVTQYDWENLSFWPGRHMALISSEVLHPNKKW